MQYTNLYKLFKIQCADLLVLREMEHNGIVFNTKKAREYVKDLEETQQKLYSTFCALINSNVVNIGSNDHISTVLYGGIIVEKIRIAIGHYKSGAKQGEVRYKIEKVIHEFPRLVEPLPKTETKKSLKHSDIHSYLAHSEGGTTNSYLKQYWEVNEPVLRSLKAKGKVKEIIDIILEYNKLDKLRGTYLEGYTKLIEEMDWEEDKLYGNLNQCVVITGRLSSSKPNLQNADKATKQFMESRYENN